jgi:hypothetical protein
MFITPHAHERLNGRLYGIISLEDVKNAVSKAGQFKIGETWIRVKSTPKKIVIREPGLTIAGDVIYVIVRRSSAADIGAVATVELRFKSQKVKGDHYVNLEARNG